VVLLAEIEERLRAVIEDDELYHAIRLLTIGDERGPRTEADRKAAMLLFRTFRPDHLEEFLKTGKVVFGDLELLASGTVRHRTKDISCVRISSDEWFPALDIVVAFYMHLSSFPDRVEEIVLRHERVIGGGVHLTRTPRTNVPWESVEDAPYIFVTAGVVAEVTGAPLHGLKALQAWCVATGMRFEKEGDSFLIHGDGGTQLAPMFITLAPRLSAMRLADVSGITLDEALRVLGFQEDPDATFDNPEWDALMERISTAVGEDPGPVTENEPCRVVGPCGCGAGGENPPPDRPGARSRVKRLVELVNGIRFRDIVMLFRDHPEEQPPEAPMTVLSSTTATPGYYNVVNVNGLYNVPVPIRANEVVGDAINGNPNTAA
jgi:hypothetical protein